MKPVFKCRRFEVFRRSVPTADGRERMFEIIAHPGAVVVLPLLADDRCVMIRQVRPAVERELWELPAGTLDKEGEEPTAAAERELEEETGYRAGRITPLCTFYSSPGITNELLRAYVATDLTPTHQRLDPAERITVEPIAIPEALAMARDGRIMDAKTIITLLLWDAEQRAKA